jgi:hypothetical protein
MNTLFVVSRPSFWADESRINNTDYSVCIMLSFQVLHWPETWIIFPLMAVQVFFSDRSIVKELFWVSNVFDPADMA